MSGSSAPARFPLPSHNRISRLPRHPRRHSVRIFRNVYPPLTRCFPSAYPLLPFQGDFPPHQHPGPEGDSAQILISPTTSIACPRPPHPEGPPILACNRATAEEHEFLACATTDRIFRLAWSREAGSCRRHGLRGDSAGNHDGGRAGCPACGPASGSVRGLASS